MKVAVVGAGALGQLYGARLAVRAEVDVVFVVRRPHVGDDRAMVLERVDDRDDALRLDQPVRVAEVPNDAAVVLVGVRAEQLDDAFVAKLAGETRAPVVVLTPLMPAEYTRLTRALGERLVPAMPGIVAYERADGIVRHWIPKVAPTLLQRSAVNEAVLEDLARALGRSGLPAQLAEHVHETNLATTVTFVPLMIAVDVAGGVDPLLADDALLRLSLRGATEAAALARKLGKLPAWGGLLTRFLRPRAVRFAVRHARPRFEEAFFYVDHHFAHKLHAQNRLLAAEVVALAEEQALPRDALVELSARIQDAHARAQA